ncbi:CLUMA_CG002037, isoform A [Clunio marinus]|uniref:CLUMA_CG002037, isoform A n=1 Tax=Clunio marinus TaxID=568069 RepID=A0A1J1HPW7_9DIPT|nr:CLUMA_CG002037, isoform A [Clunio marinus]
MSEASKPKLNVMTAHEISHEILIRIALLFTQQQQQEQFCIAFATKIAIFNCNFLICIITFPFLHF